MDWGFTARKRNGKTMFFVITFSVKTLIPEDKKNLWRNNCALATVAQSTQLLFTFTI